MGPEQSFSILWKSLRVHVQKLRSDPETHLAPSTWPFLNSAQSVSVKISRSDPFPCSETTRPQRDVMRVSIDGLLYGLTRTLSAFLSSKLGVGQAKQKSINRHLSEAQ
jgi:hypothetical protein